MKGKYPEAVEVSRPVGADVEQPELKLRKDEHGEIYTERKCLTCGLTTIVEGDSKIKICWHCGIDMDIDNQVEQEDLSIYMDDTTKQLIESNNGLCRENHTLTKIWNMYCKIKKDGNDFRYLLKCINFNHDELITLIELLTIRLEK